MVGSTAEPEPQPELVAASQAVTLRGEAVDVGLTLTSTAPSARRLPSGAAEEPAAPRVILVLDDLTADQDPGIAYAVFVATPDGRRQHVGNLSLFGIGRGTPAASASLRHVFDATTAIASLGAPTGVDPSTLRVAFEPILVEPPPSARAQSLRAADVAAVRVGRVGLYVL